MGLLCALRVGKRSRPSGSADRTRSVFRARAFYQGDGTRAPQPRRMNLVWGRSLPAPFVWRLLVTLGEEPVAVRDRASPKSDKGTTRQHGLVNATPLIMSYPLLLVENYWAG